MLAHEAFKNDANYKRANWWAAKSGQKAFITEVNGWFDTYKGVFEDGSKFEIDK